MRIALGILCLAGTAFVSPAQSADIVPSPPPPPPSEVFLEHSDWSGLYAGGHIGWGWVDTTGTQLQNVPAFPAGTSVSATADGFLGGFQVGYDFQASIWIVGVEFDYSWLDASESVISTSTIIPAVTTTSTQDTDAFYSLTGKIGGTISPSTVLYVEGGIAWAEVENTLVTPVAAATVSDTLNGYTIGAGIETQIYAGWSMELEYTYADFGSETYTFANSTSPFEVDTDIHLVRLGINYRFN